MKPTNMKEPRIEMLHLPKIFAIATIGNEDANIAMRTKWL